MKEKNMSGLSKVAVWLRERGIDAKAMDEGIIEWRANKDIILNVA